MNKHWQRYLKSEEELLRELYPNAPKEDIIKALPGRTWIALRRKAEKMGLKRVFKERKEYLVRRSIITLTGEEWRKLDEMHPYSDFKTTAESFLDQIGLPGGKSACYNLSERAFFDEIYALYRRRLKNSAEVKSKEK